MLPPPVSQSPFYSGDLITYAGWQQVSWPSAIYNVASNETFVSWQFVGVGGYKGVHVSAYDHGSNSWSRPHKAGSFLLPDNDHGHPTLLRDADGYIHCFYGSHATAQQWSVTSSPDDISTWNKMPAIAGQYTYPRPVLVGSDIHLFLRDHLQQRGLAVLKMTPTDGVGTWGAPALLVDFGSSARVYGSEAHEVSGKIHLTCTHADGNDTKRTGVYYLVYDPPTGSLSNYDGSVTVASASLPIDLTDANASFRVYDHGANDGDIPSLQFDSLGRPHLLVADGVSPNYDLMHTFHDGGAWATPEKVAEIYDQHTGVGYVDAYCLAPLANGAMEAWYNVDDDRARRVRTSGGVWSAEEIVAEHDQYPFGHGSAVKDASASLRAVISERTEGVLDSQAGYLGLFAHGDGGFIGSSIPDSEDPMWGDVTLLVGAGGVGSTSALDESKSCLPISMVGPIAVEAEAPFVGGRSFRTYSGAYFTAPQSAAISTAGTEDFCIDVPFKVVTVDARLQVLASSRTRGFSLFLNGDRVLQFIMWGASDTLVLNVIGIDDVEAGKWHLASVERAGTQVTLYLDGVIQGSATQTGVPAIGESPVNFGRDPQVPNRHLDGWICEPRFTRAARYGGSFTPPATLWPR